MAHGLVISRPIHAIGRRANRWPICKRTWRTFKNVLSLAICRPMDPRSERHPVVKRVDLLKRLSRAGCVLVRQKGKHDIYENPATGERQPIPRHREVKEHLAKHILKMLIGE